MFVAHVIDPALSILIILTNKSLIRSDTWSKEKCSENKGSDICFHMFSRAAFPLSGKETAERSERMQATSGKGMENAKKKARKPSALSCAGGVRWLGHVPPDEHLRTSLGRRLQLDLHGTGPQSIPFDKSIRLYS